MGEVPKCLSIQTMVHHKAELEGHPLWHIQPVQFVMQQSQPTGQLVAEVSATTSDFINTNLQTENILRKTTAVAETSTN